MITPIVLWRGPSALDGAPIVVLATTESSNRKTGTMVQTWIMRADVAPHVALSRGADASICGACPRRRSTGGDCYVLVHNAPRATWDLWDRHGRPGENWTEPRHMERLQADALASGLRLGSYGDPMAVPHHVWADLIDATQPRSVVGYTHQWRASHQGLVNTERAIWYRSHVMASCDTPWESLEASALGWRYFLAVPAAQVALVPTGAVECLATREESPRTCATCGICNGARARDVQPASVYLAEHGAMSGAKARRASALQVIA